MHSSQIKKVLEHDPNVFVTIPLSLSREQCYYPSMTQPYECEVRFKIENIDAFEATLAKLGAKIALPYEFTDHYYKPAGTPKQGANVS